MQPRRSSDNRLEIIEDTRRRQFLSTSAVLLICATITRHARATEGASTIRLRDLYNKDLSFSDLATSLVGTQIRVLGYMAPPLKAVSSFFVLTNRPMSVCPFCESDADWPQDILAVYTRRRIKVVPFNAKITVRGTLELGGQKDADNGFYSRIRLVNASYQRG